MNWDFAVYGIHGLPQILPVTSPYTDTMLSPLIFPQGELGWAPKIFPIIGSARNYASLLQYYSHMLVSRDEFNPCFYMGTLLRELIIDAFTRIDVTG